VITTPSISTMFEDFALMTMGAWLPITLMALSEQHDIDLVVGSSSRDLEICEMDESRVAVRHTSQLAGSVDIHEVWMFVLVGDEWIQRHYRVRAMEYL
jgi:hypothetical protein